MPVVGGINGQSRSVVATTAEEVVKPDARSLSEEDREKLDRMVEALETMNRHLELVTGTKDPII